MFRFKILFQVLLALPLLTFAQKNLPVLPEDSLYSWDVIQDILKHESSVTYRDGKQPLGAFFLDVHRRYLPLDSMPPLLVKAVVSAEDKNFYEHKGLDYKALASAVFSNLTKFSLKRGGSTITQQTAKNLYQSPAQKKMQRLLQKGPELKAAFKLEKYLTKNQILEIYLNQFFVSGNGRGAGIAAQYFFKQDLKKLGILELAFIAGSVKGPNQYNPFTAANTEIRDKKLKRAHDRAIYVLKRMYEDKHLTKEVYEKERKRTLPFKKGDFRFSLSNPLTLVQKELEKKEIKAILEEYDVTDVYEAGLKIITTLDHDVQIQSEIALQKQLSRLDRILLGDQAPKSNQQVSRTGTLLAGEYLLGKICSLLVDKSGVPQRIQVQFGVAKGWVEKPELNTWLEDLHFHLTGIERPLGQKFLKEQLQTRLKLGALVECLVLWPKKGNPSLALIQRSRIQGSVQVLHKGEVLAHVGGFENQGYDRVAQARRQFGSTVKPYVYAAALELGWHPLDSLDNRPQLFQLGSTLYYPRATHESPPFVSMAWACKNSDNIASVWLMYHLFDKKSHADFWAEARKLGAHPDNFDTDEDFINFVQDTLGFSLSEGQGQEMIFSKVKKAMVVELFENNNDEEAEWLRKLPFGRGWIQELAKISSNHSPLETQRIQFLKHSYSYYVHDNFLNNPGETQHLSSNLLEILQKLKNQFDQALAQETPTYTLEHLYESSEFRAAMAIRYTVQFCKRLGIQSFIDPVLSFPLGSSTLSLAEATTAYSRMVTGYSWKSRKLKSEPVLIQKIFLSDGTLIYQDKAQSQEVISPRTRLGLASMLREVVRAGTAARLNADIQVKAEQAGVVLPALGKTGTTNDFRNSAFMGALPLPPQGSGKFSLEEAAAIGIYIGFDRNQSMKIHSFRGFGGNTVLSPWADVAAALAQAKQVAAQIRASGSGLPGYETGFIEGQDLEANFSVQKETGLEPGKNTWGHLLSFFQPKKADDSNLRSFTTISR